MNFRNENLRRICRRSSRALFLSLPHGPNQYKYRLGFLVEHRLRYCPPHTCHPMVNKTPPVNRRKTADDPAVTPINRRFLGSIDPIDKKSIRKKSIIGDRRSPIPVLSTISLSTISLADGRRTKLVRRWRRSIAYKRLHSRRLGDNSRARCSLGFRDRGGLYCPLRHPTATASDFHFFF